VLIYKFIFIKIIKFFLIFSISNIDLFLTYDRVNRLNTLLNKLKIILNQKVFYFLFFIIIMEIENKYLSLKDLEKIKTHSYKTTGYSKLDNLMNPFWIWAADLLPNVSFEEL